MYDVLVTHNVQSQKTGAFNRYVVDDKAQHSLKAELAKGFVVINKWLANKHLPRLPLPAACGYAPLISEIYEGLMKKALHLEL